MGHAKRGFSDSEYQQRTAAAQAVMAQQGLELLIFTTEANVRYFSGFLSQFWHSPTRPWYLLVPISGKPIAVIPSIGELGMRATWLDDIRTWPAPQPEDDGISLLIETVQACVSKQGKVGMTLGYHSQLRMPVADFIALRKALGNTRLIDSTPLITKLRSVKSAAEISKIETACHIASDAFAALPDFISCGMDEREITRIMRINMLESGSDSTPFIVAGSGHGGYRDIIMGPTDRVCDQGDVLIIDTGTQYDGYFCDFDRNFAFGSVSDDTVRAYDLCYQATDAGFNAAKPGARFADVWQAMSQILSQGLRPENTVGRYGHGLGMELTEGASIIPDDQTELQQGTVLTLEPSLAYSEGFQMVHEENIVIEAQGARYLSDRAKPEITIIGR